VGWGSLPMAVLGEAWHGVGGGGALVRWMMRKCGGNDHWSAQGGSNVDRIEGPEKGETEAGSQCDALRWNSPW
jgi:hypothetical protein